MDQNKKQSILDDLILDIYDGDFSVTFNAVNQIVKMRDISAINSMLTTFESGKVGLHIGSQASQEMSQDSFFDDPNLYHRLIDTFGYLFPAVKKLEELASPTSVTPLINLLKKSKMPGVATVIGKLGFIEAVDPLIELVEHSGPEVKYYTIRALGRLGDKRALPILEKIKVEDTNLFSSPKGLIGKSNSQAAEASIELIKNNTDSYIKDPTKITEDSFEMIRRELRDDHGLVFESPVAEVIERMVHSTADFDFGKITVIDATAVNAGIEALRKGCAVVCDVNMIRVGVSARNIEKLSGSLHCFVNDEAVRPKAAELGNTRSAAGIHLAHERGLLDGGIVVIGNAPTALYAIIELIEAGVKPALVVGVPVGFISAIESKDDLLARVDGVPVIVTKGRKGGSPVAVSIVNALLRFALDRSHTEAEP